MFKKKDLLFEDDSNVMGKRIDKRKPITPSSKRKLMLLDMSETVYGHNHEYGKIVKRMFLSNVKPDMSQSSAKKDLPTSILSPSSRLRTS
jgi:hypothetical protein